ncbi:sushi, von Willebrand factor type A, EGF and pentraxin domain-containing protein 1-like [Physella acuta]|uniref:sushi, von Willebrand factor type A, EGF and pentraxin domain-containing protein 1-like n=1 Tax=Physella acuta TaxID=109671 RepID=UPI0027DBEB79|nr:sushi, von Willebrand factor type A, EGF and pentraxin domain-containing protein 1-like [Physella acuta]
MHNTNTQTHKHKHGNIDEPSALDNVEVTSLTRSPVNHYMSQVLGENRVVTYVASDGAGNNSTCTVYINIKDEEPPVIGCVPSYVLTLQNSSHSQQLNLSQLVTSASDNSGPVALTFTPAGLVVDRYSVGETYTVKVTGTDSSGNTDQCMVQVKVQAPACVDWSLHINNASTTCVSTGSGLICTVTCDAGYVMYENPQLEYVNITCSSGGPWSRNTPVCVAIRDAPYIQSHQLQYNTGSAPLPACSATYQSQLHARIPDLVAKLNTLCNGTTPLTYVVALDDTPVLSLSNSVVIANYVLSIWAAKGSSPAYTTAAIDQCANLIQNAFVGRTDALMPVLRLTTDSGCSGSSIADYNRILQNGYQCGNNEVINYSLGTPICLSCPPGYSSIAGSKCTPCPAATYFSSTQGFCVSCPGDTRWTLTGARSLMECYLTCPYGYTSATGQALCQACPQNTYSSDQKTCTPCPPGKFTSRTGQGLITGCLDPCLAGYFSPDGLAQCRACPLGFYQNSSHARTCYECPSNQTTQVLAATSSADCVEGAPLLCDTSKCQNGGTCLVAGHDYFCQCVKGYSGRNCELYTSPCTSQPCFNNATCVVTGTTTYRCDCPYGHLSGVNCEVNNNTACLNNPCHNYGKCQTGVSSYNCMCPSYSQYTYPDNTSLNE